MLCIGTLILHGFRHLDFSLVIRTTGSRSSPQKPETESRQLNAEHRPPSNQISGGLVLGDTIAPSFDADFVLRRVIDGSLSFVFLSLTCRVPSRLFPRRSLPWLFTTAARGGLESASGSRIRRANLHLLWSFSLSNESVLIPPLLVAATAHMVQDAIPS